MKMAAFSLFELLVVLFILCVLLSVATPTYLSYVHGSYRKEAALTLLQLSAKLSAYHFEYHTYEGVTLASLDISDNLEKSYQFKIDQQSQFHYLISAKPLFNDARCGTLTMDALQKKQISGTGLVSDCW